MIPLSLICISQNCIWVVDWIIHIFLTSETDHGELVGNRRGGSLIICYSFSWNTKVFNLECMEWGWVGWWNGWAKKGIFMRDSNSFERQLFLERQQDWVSREMFASSNRIYICLIFPIYNSCWLFSSAAYWVLNLGYCFGHCIIIISNFLLVPFKIKKTAWQVI